MAILIKLIAERLSNLNLANPLYLIDLAAALLVIIAFLLYLSKFPVFRVVLGTLFLMLCAVIFLLGGFLLTSLVFGMAAGLILISLPLIFAPETRHYLEKLGRFSFLRLPNLTARQRKSAFIRNLVEAVYMLAEKKTGALVVVARQTGLGETIETGTIIDARFGAKLLESIFYPKNPLHDGAVVVKEGRIVSAGCLLPIHSEVKLENLGTRHKAGVAITQDTDAVVIIVSEQTGAVSLAENGKLQLKLDRINLTQNLQRLL